MMERWHDRYLMQRFVFEERNAILVHPEQSNGKWMLKTEYFDAFPQLELAMLERGWTLAYLQNQNRWGVNEDLDAKLRFRDELVRRHGLSPRCVPIGMSCGGLHAVKLAARHPEMIQALYLDAPVIDLLNCPFGLHGNTSIPVSVQREALDALGLSMAEMLVYNAHPLQLLPRLTDAQIPVVLVCGGKDTTVPYEYNGKHVQELYTGSGIPFLFQYKPECDHHPHGPDNMQAVIEFLEKSS